MLHGIVLYVSAWRSSVIKAERSCIGGLLRHSMCTRAAGTPLRGSHGSAGAHGLSDAGTCLQDGSDAALHSLAHFHCSLPAQDQCVHNVVTAPPQEHPRGPADEFEAAPNGGIVVQAFYHSKAVSSQQNLHQTDLCHSTNAGEL